MIVVLKHNKCGNMVYISHVDLIRHFTRAFRRAGLEIEFSQGFNPHMLINLGTPLPLGINSCAEYVTVHTNTCAKDFMERYNAVAPKGLEASKAFDVIINPNIAGKTVAADYSISQIGAEANKKAIEGIVNLPTFEITTVKKGEEITKDVAPLINAIKVQNDKINFCLAAGNTTLRADRFAEALANKYSFSVNIPELWKYEQYVRENGVLCDMDTYLASLSDKK